jgi:hypothetical protein
MPYSVGHNISVYLPESDVSYAETFEDAKAVLIADLLEAADDAQSNDENTLADELDGLAQDVNLESGPQGFTYYSSTNPDSEYDLPTAWWVAEISQEEYDEACQEDDYR